MKKFLSLFLTCLLIATLFVACGEKVPASVSQYKAEGEFTPVQNKLSWEAIDALPKKSANMTEDEMRQLVVDFYNYSKTVVWVAGSDVTYQVNTALGRNTLRTGTVYAGMPYVSLGSGNIYRLMDYMDTEKGVLDAASAGQVETLFGNQCSISTFWAWGRVMNSANYCYTKDAVVNNGFLRVGDYTYPDDVKEFSAVYGTLSVQQDNGEEVIFESYAQTKKGDGMVHNNQSGHIIMLTGDTVVVRDAEGKIDPENSYMIYSDQNTPWRTDTNAQGDTYNYTSGVDKQMSFRKAFDKYYVPFTFKEFAGLDPVEETEVSYSHSGETLSRSQLFGSKITANYSLSDIYVQIFDKKGNEVYKLAVRATVPTIYELTFTEEGENVIAWGSLDNVTADSTAKVYVQLATGERPTLWEGKFIAE
ncbi:MAG: hypothetical protein J6Q54_02015 [Oscillospiraceae bacterium]|nr:hypothetical protein [Oscillospiraceae bacterium]